MDFKRDSGWTRAVPGSPVAHEPGRRTQQPEPGLMALQRSMGNRAVVEMLRRSGRLEGREPVGGGAAREGEGLSVQRASAALGSAVTAALPARLADLSVQRTEEGLTLGANTSGQSRAADAGFEAEAMAFERKLAAKASSHSAAKGAMADMASKAKAYIRSGVGGAWEHADQQLAEVFNIVGQEGVEKSGFVGTAVSDVMAVFDEGTLSERYTHIVRFFTEVLARDLATPAKREDIDQRMKEARLNMPFLLDRRRAMLAAGGSPESVTTRDIAPVPSGSAVEHQGNARVRRNDVLKALHPDQEPGETGRTEHTVAETGLDFSGRQEAMHTKDDPTWDKQQSALKWLAGAKVWMINEKHAWVEAQRKLSLPLGGGPSGTTNTMMSAAKALNADKYGARLASIAFLVGASHHTLVEIMAAAEPFGCEYDPTQGLYRNIKPLTEDELRACGKDGRFPGEPTPTTTGTGNRA